MSILAALCDLLGFERHYWTCCLIERLRPGHGHCWSDRTDPLACMWCGCTRPAIARRKAQPGC